MTKCIRIVGVRSHNRAENGPEMQKVFTRHGHIIMNRSGIPSPDRETGIISLICEAEENEVKDLVGDLQGVEGVIADFMTLECIPE